MSVINICSLEFQGRKLTSCAWRYLAFLAATAGQLLELSNAVVAAKLGMSESSVERSIAQLAFCLKIENRKDADGFHLAKVVRLVRPSRGNVVERLKALRERRLKALARARMAFCGLRSRKENWLESRVKPTFSGSPRDGGTNMESNQYLISFPRGEMENASRLLSHLMLAGCEVNGVDNL